MYCDFDGTVCRNDIGEEFFSRYGGERVHELVKLLLAGTISMQEWLRKTCDAVPPTTHEEFLAAIASYEVDPTFPPFVAWMEQQHASVMVLSDGLDAYLEPVLKKGGLERVPFAANHAVFEERAGQVRLGVTFPHTDAECALCGNCKRNHMLIASADDDLIVYAGDGYSDRCPVRYADVIFAKRQLIPYCQQQNITYHAFDTFDDIRFQLEEIVARKRVRHRREAVMARRDAFMQG
jgi:2,3-diketo-5-methylthio-1-phosphopentane phosphatase